MLTRAYLISYFLLFYCALLAQQNPQLYFKNYGTEEGLPSPEVHCALEDSRGYMWFGTDNGAARFDGYDFEVFSRKEGLNNPVVLEIYEDKEGRVWLGTMSGNVYIWDKGKIAPWKYNHLTQIFAKNVSKGSLQYLSKSETAYFEFSDYGFVIIDSSGKIDTITGSKAVNKIVLKVPNEDKCIYTSINKRDWKSTAQISVDNRYRTNWDFESINESQTNEFILKKNKEVGAASYVQYLNEGLLIFDYGGVFFIKDNEFSMSSAFHFRVTQVMQDLDKGIWVCLNGGEGVRRYEKHIDLFNNKKYEQYLEGESVSSIIQDSQGGYWINTLSNGIFYVKDPRLLLYNKKIGFPENYTTSVTFKNKNILYAGFENGEIVKINRKQKKIELLPKNSTNFKKQSLYYDKERSILYSHLYSFKNNNWQHAWHLDQIGKLVPYFSSSKPISFVTSDKIYVCEPGGMNVYDKQSNFVEEPTLNFGFKRTYDVIVDWQEQTWIGTNDGLQQFTDQFLAPPNPDLSFHTRVEAIEELTDSTIVFGTKGSGVTFWKKDSVVNLTTQDGLTSDIIENIYIDEHETIWVGTFAGLNKIVKNKDGTFNIRQYNMATGLPSNEIHEVKSNEGELWICTSEGLVKFHEHEEEKIAKVPLLQEVSVNDSFYSTDTTILFSYDQSNFNFQWLTINFRQNGKIPYRYRLNTNGKWNYTQNLSTEYPALPPGNYTFEVQSQNEDRYWSVSATYEFSISPPWWSTWWFRGSAIILLGLGAYYFYSSRLQRVIRENQVQKQISDLEKSALQAQMNPHFIFNCLNSIQNFILQNDTKKAVEYLSRFARLVRHNLNASVNGRIYLEEEISLLDNYLALEKERFNNNFSYQIDVSEELRSQLITIPPLLIQPYVENAVIHGLANMKSDGIISIAFQRESDLLIIKVKDNGKGYRIEKNKAKQGRHKSVGMSITKDRLRLLNGEDNVEIKWSTGASEEEQGTEVIIKIKTQKS